MLHSGIRNAEIAALQVDDLKELKGGDRSVWVFDINTKADKKRVKSPNAVRQVPVHQKLIDLGLLEFREQIQALGQLRLFPYLKWEKGNGYGRYLGENFSTYLKTLGIHSNRKKVLYSFRHTIATRLERANVPVHRIEQISGRSLQGFKPVGQQFYISPAEAIDLYDDLMKVHFNDQLMRVKNFSSMVSSPVLSRILKAT